MPPDIELLRDILLYLETRQVSPRATVIIDLTEEAAALGYRTPDFAEGLRILDSLAYIEGPGAEGPALWLFRKLTAKGVQFVRAAANPNDWERLKASRSRRVAGE